MVAGILLILVVLMFFATNEAMGYYFENCYEEDVFDCMMGILEEEEEPEPDAVAATGGYEYKGYTVSLTVNVPLGGGSLSGAMTGACDGKVTGSYDGQNNGVISGKITGTCDPFVVKIPASADFNGTVNKTGKTVPIRFTGRGGGITHQGSMSLGYTVKAAE